MFSEEEFEVFRSLWILFALFSDITGKGYAEVVSHALGGGR